MNNSAPRLRWAPLSQFAQEPIRATDKSAGLDLFSAYDYVIPAEGFSN